MNKRLLKDESEFQNWFDSQSYDYTRYWFNSRKLDIDSPKMYPCLVVWDWITDSDDGLFLINEFVYLTDFNL